MIVSELYHYGIKGQKWGTRRWQNLDGSLTSAGRIRYYGSDYRKDYRKPKSRLSYEDRIAGTSARFINRSKLLDLKTKQGNFYISRLRGAQGKSLLGPNDKGESDPHYLDDSKKRNKSFQTPHPITQDINGKNKANPVTNTSRSAQAVDRINALRIAPSGAPIASKKGTSSDTKSIDRRRNSSNSIQNAVRDIQEYVQGTVNEVSRRAQNAQELVSNFVRDINNPPAGSGFDDGYDLGYEFGLNFVNNLFGRYR